MSSESPYHRKRRTCKTGCGMEATPGKCDTPGFALADTPSIRYDHKRTQKLYMPRNNSRVNQTSVDLLRSWRGNCDVQIIVYNCDPKKPNVGEIARGNRLYCCLFMQGKFNDIGREGANEEANITVCCLICMQFGLRNVSTLLKFMSSCFSSEELTGDINDVKTFEHSMSK